ncbi:MAG: hypothetical protein IJD55_03575 [Clostridia bacterium]|nr:hypothetical protein [Clostridia bacterium]
MMTKKNRKAYLLCNKNDIDYSFHEKVNVTDEYVLYYDAQSLDIADKTCGDKRIIVLGIFVDCRDSNLTNNDIANGLLSAFCESKQALIKEGQYIAGHYVIIAVSNGEIVMLPDACSTYAINYAVYKKSTVVCSNAKLLADILGYTEDPEAIKIKKNTNIGEALPNDRTMYKEIKSVLPNHILNLSDVKSERFFPNDSYKKGNLEEVCAVTAEYLRNILKGLLKRGEWSLPLTGGIDSRTILAAIGKENASKIKYYTYRHKHFTHNTSDIVIPKKIADDYNLDYMQIPDLTATDELIEYYANEIENDPETFTPSLCYTYSQSELNGRYFLSGGIAPVGKSVYGNLLPEFFCTSSYLLVKAHNSSREAYCELKKWLKEIKPYCKKSGISAFDMFYWEYRCGRWDQRTHLLIDAVIDMVSPYNCGEILSLWVTVDRKHRQQKKIHKRIIEICWKELAEYPTNPDSGLTSAIKKHRYLYWICSYVFWIKETILRKIRR